MAVQYEPPPFNSEIISQNPRTKQWEFSPAWRLWFTRLAKIMTTGGAGGTWSLDHNSLSGLEGGLSSHYYHLGATAYALLTSVQSAGTVLSGPLSGAAALPTYKSLDTHAVKTGDTSLASTTTLTDDPDLKHAIGANETWIGRTFVAFGAGVKTTGVKVSLTVPTGASGKFHAAFNTDATAAQETEVFANVAFASAADFTAASVGAGATVALCELIWYVANGANAGNVTLQWAQSTSSLTALVAYTGSQSKADRTA